MSAVDDDLNIDVLADAAVAVVAAVAAAAAVAVFVVAVMDIIVVVVVVVVGSDIEANARRPICRLYRALRRCCCSRCRCE